MLGFYFLHRLLHTRWLGTESTGYREYRIKDYQAIPTTLSDARGTIARPCSCGRRHNMKPDKPSSTAMFVANGIWWVTNNPKLTLEVPELMGSLNLGMVQHFNSGFFSPEHRIGSWFRYTQSENCNRIS